MGLSSRFPEECADYFKPNKSPTNCTLYRPVSQFNTDAKIIAMVMAR